MITITRDQLSALLHTGECVVEFTKVDGTVRTMPCTLNEALLPLVHITNTDNPVDFPTPKKEKKQNPDIMGVWTKRNGVPSVSPM